MAPIGVITAMAWLQIATAVVVAVALTRIVAPYGRHARPGWGPELPSTLGWVVMEAPSPLLFLAATAATGGSPIYLGLWLLHYGYRAFVYPFLSPGRPMPVSIAMSGALFNVVNGTINGSVPAPEPSHLASPTFLLGLVVFLAGFGMHVDADRRLRLLRREVEGYGIPRGGGFRWVSCPNYLGEIVQWWGWALLTGALPGLAFAVFTTANLAPRAVAHHAWYRRTFPDYPPERTALVPLVGP